MSGQATQIIAAAYVIIFLQEFSKEKVVVRRLDDRGKLPGKPYTVYQHVYACTMSCVGGAWATFFACLGLSAQQTQAAIGE